MGFFTAPKLQRTGGTAKSGISMSMSVSPKAQRKSVRITMTEAAQQRIFGRKLKPDHDRMDFMIGRGGVDEGHAKIILRQNGAVPISSGVKGSAFIRIGHWDLLPEHKRPAAEIKQLGDPEIEGDAITVLLLLPDWASPKKRERAAMSAKRHAAGEGRT